MKFKTFLACGLNLSRRVNFKILRRQILKFQNFVAQILLSSSSQIKRPWRKAKNFASHIRSGAYEIYFKIRLLEFARRFRPHVDTGFALERIEARAIKFTDAADFN
jgi:hypothetical protein